MENKVQSVRHFYPEIHLEHDSPVPLHHQLAENIRRSLERRRIPGGTPLPSMLTLAEDLKLNRNTVRRAYGTLEADGILRREPSGRILQVTPEFAESYCNRFLPALGMVLPDRMEDLLQQETHSALEIVGGIMDTAAQFGFAAMIVPLPEQDHEFERLNQWLKEMISKLNGLIYLGESGDRHHDRAFELLLAEESLPQVFVGGKAFRPHLGTVTIDMDIGFAAAAEHLAELGHRSVAAVSSWIPRREIFQLQTIDRPSCMLNALGKCFKMRDEWILSGCRYDDAFRSALRNILAAENRPSALVFSSDELTHYGLPVLRELGLRIPEDISLISFDDTNRAKSGNPPWASIRNPRRRSGREAVEMIVESRRENKPVNTLNRNLPSSLIIRQSTAPYNNKQH